jgi:beta-lactam-binding protein with PASTA domain
MAGTRPAGTAVLPRTGPAPARPPVGAPSRSPARRRRSFRAPLIGLIILALIIGLVALLRSLNGGTVVPDVRGQQLSAARATLANAGFRDIQVNGTSGVVQSQDPSGGDRANKDDQIKLTLGSQAVAPATTNIDASDYIGRRLGDVRSDLSSQGFTVSLSGSTDPNATVTAISPTGDVRNGSVISVRSRLPQAATRSPAPASTSASPSPRPTTAPPSSSAPSSGNSGNGNGNSGNGNSGNGNGGGINLPLPGSGNGNG